MQAFQSDKSYKLYLADKIAKMVEELVISALLIPRDDLHRPSDMIKQETTSDGPDSQAAKPHWKVSCFTKGG